MRWRLVADGCCLQGVLVVSPLVKQVTRNRGRTVEPDEWEATFPHSESCSLENHVSCWEESERLRAEVKRLSEQLKRDRENESRYQVMVEDSPNPICFTDGAGVISCANESFCSFFLLDREKVIGKELFQLLPKSKREQIRREFGCLTPESPFRNSEPQLYGSSGTRFWEKWSMRAFFDASGRRTGCQLQGQDITATKELQNLSMSMDTIFENTPIGVVYSENQTIKRVNPALCDLLGYEEGEVRGEKIPFDMVAAVRERLPEFIERFERGESFYCETELFKKDGNHIEAFVLTVPVRTETDELAHYTFVKDISEHKELEKQLLRTDLVVSRSPLVLFQGTLTQGIPLDYVSENIRQFGYSPEGLTASRTPLNSLIHPEDLGNIREEVERDEREGNLAREHLYRLKTTDDRYRWVSERNQIIPGEGEAPDSVVGILLDVTERKQAEMEIRDSHQRLETQVARLERAWEQTIGLLAAVTELRDPYTMGHQRRVAHLSGAISREMGLEERQIQEIVRAALVHDIGKIHIPSEFLCKPGKLSPQEFGIIKDHAHIGADLLRTIELPWPLARIVVEHHERLDGSGYPKGLKGKEILLPARILAVADVVEAMASHRPYRPALGVDKALDEIVSNSGRLYDPEAVSACQRLFYEKGYVWPEVV